MIKGIFFDAAGVLYRRSSPTAVFAMNLLKQRNFLGEASEKENRHLEKMRVDASQGLKSYEAYWHQFLLFHGVDDLETRVIMIKKITDFSNDVLPVEGCKEALTVLKERGFILGIISDTIYPLEWKMKRLSRAGVADLIDIVACSTDLGMHKPDPAFYRYALHEANLSPKESAFVGHDAKELRGARRAGMATVAVNHDLNAKADHYCKSIIEITTLTIFSRSDLELSG